MPFSNKAKDEFANQTQWTQEEALPIQQPAAPVDHADEFENVTAWWWNPDAVKKDSSEPQTGTMEDRAAAQPDSVTFGQARSAGQGKVRWAGQSLGVYRRLVTRTMKEIMAAKGLIEDFATDAALNEVYVALKPMDRVMFNQEVHDLVENRLAALNAWLPRISPETEENADEGHEYQKRLVFAGPGGQPGAEFVLPDTQYDRLRFTDFVVSHPKTRAEKLFLKHYNELLQTAYEKTLREFGLDPNGQNSDGVVRRFEVKDDEANIYEICRATYEKMDATPMVAALALALGKILI